MSRVCLTALCEQLPSRLITPLRGKGNLSARKRHVVHRRLLTSVASSSRDTRKSKVAECARIMQLPAEFSEPDVRDAFVRLSKKYHPDSRTEFSCPSTFSKIKEAYTYLINVLQNPDVEEHDASKELPDIKHTVPQHRQYLSFEGVGYGNIMQRQRQYDQFRVDRANERIFQHRADKSIRENEHSLVQLEKTKKEAQKIKTRNHMERLVEDLIKESMARGDFDNLPGAGKPLRSSSHDNPYIDSTTYNLNKILINNGFTPEWIALEKEIKDTYLKLKDDLRRAYEIAGHGEQENFWQTCAEDFRESVRQINKKIDKFNIVAPSLRLQMAHYSAEKAIADIATQRYAPGSQKKTQTAAVGSGGGDDGASAAGEADVSLADSRQSS